MKKLSLLFLSLALVAFFPPRKKRIVFLGDSITQAAVEPGGYIDHLRKMLQKKGVQNDYELIGAGISGNKVPDLQKRLEKDVLSRKPDVVFVYIGINDVWHFTHPSTNGQGTPVDQYESGLTDVITRIKKTGAAVVLCTPSVIGEKSDGTNPQDAMLDQYADVSRRVAKATGVQLLDLRREFIQYLTTHNPQNDDKNVLTSDGVHLNPPGNQFVAEQMMKMLMP